MIFKEKKTPTLLMMPLANGWRAVHKKYKNEYGTVICTEKGDTVEIVTDFGEFSTERTEAVESAAAMIFENNGVKEITVDGEKLTREAWQEKEDARLNALHRTREDYKKCARKARALRDGQAAWLCAPALSGDDLPRELRLCAGRDGGG